MTRSRQIKTTFTSGEVSRRLIGRGDLRAYENGAQSLRNLFIHPTGGVSRRTGMRYVDSVAGSGRLISFEFNTEQTYLLVLTDMQLDIYLNDIKVETLVTPWSESQIPLIAWTQSADTLLLVHPDVSPRRLTRDISGSWALNTWSFFVDETSGQNTQPYFKFAQADVTLTPSGVSGNISLTASSDVFVAGHVNTRLRVGGKEVEIINIASPTVVDVTTVEDLLSTDATIDWVEQAFSPVRGWPVSVAFHQDRLVIGGSRDLPNRLWFSKSGDLFNFDLGEGLDDEAIEFGILSDQVNAIRAVFSGRHLQVFTSGAEWQVTGNPLTPVTVQLNRQTRVGSPIDRFVAPIDVDGATLFVARNGRELREFLYTDIEQAYSSTDLALLARHILQYPIDQAYDGRSRLLHVVRADGKLASLTVYRAEQVAAWTLHETDGQILSVASVGDTVYLMVLRNGQVMIEVFDENMLLDSSLIGSSATPKTLWSGLDHLEGQTVSILADGIVQDDQIVSGGSVTLLDAAEAVQIGLSYTHIVEPLPPNTVSQNGAGRAVRLVEVIFRVEDTAALRVDVGRGLSDIPLRDFDDEIVLDGTQPIISGDVAVHAFGWSQDNTQPLWKIEQSLPLSFNLLSVTTELKIND